MEEKLITFETAVLAKEQYFNIDTYYAYSKYGLDDYQLKIYHSSVYQGPDPIYLAPTQSLLQRWLFETHRIWIETLPIAEDKKHGIYWAVRIWDLNNGRTLLYTVNSKGNPYSVLEKGLFEALNRLND